MAEKISTTQENQKTNYFDYATIERKMAEIGGRFGENTSIQDFIKAFGESIKTFSAEPYIQNRRIKSINSTPAEYSDTQIAEMTANPIDNEQELRKTEKFLEGTTPLGEIRKVYQDIPLYYNYAYPTGADGKEFRKEDFEVDERLIDKIISKLNAQSVGREITGQALQEGKVFRWLRSNITETVENTTSNKDTNKTIRKKFNVNYFNLTPLPSDWVKIVAFNDMSKYTVAFNLMYLKQSGVNPYDYIELFAPYLEDFDNVVYQKNNRWTINMAKFADVKRKIDKKCVDNADSFKDIRKKIAAGGYLPEVYIKNGIQYYWVVLPIDRVWTFEIDPSTTWVVPPYINTFLAMTRITKGEQIQMEVLQNPLVAFITGEVPFTDSKSKGIPDNPKLSPGMIEYWLYQLLNGLYQQNVSGIGGWLAPVNNIKMHQLADSPNASEMATDMYQYTMLKANMGGLIPISDKPLAEQVKSAQKIKAKYAQEIYNCFERMMNTFFLYSENLKYNWRFKMFGDIFSIESEKAEIQKELANGITTALYRYYAIEGKTLLNARTMLRSINESGIIDMFKPLKTSYTQSGRDGGRPSLEETGADGAEGSENNQNYK